MIKQLKIYLLMNAAEGYQTIVKPGMKKPVLLYFYLSASSFVNQDIKSFQESLHGKTISFPAKT